MIARADLAGHWQRTWLRAPGVEDSTTRVHWLQVGPWCADIRVPRDRPGIDAAPSLAAMAPADLAILLTAEGFAGRITLEGSLCTWHRDWNWQGFPCPVDAATLGFDARGRLIEDGAEADYREEWQHHPLVAPTAEAVVADGASGLLISHAAGFLLALGTRGAPGLPATLRDGWPGAAAAPAFDSTYVMGHWADGSGVADLSTQPFCEGRTVLTRQGDGARLVLPDFHGRAVTQALRLTPLPSD